MSEGKGYDFKVEDGDQSLDTVKVKVIIQGIHEDLKKALSGYVGDTPNEMAVSFIPKKWHAETIDGKEITVYDEVEITGTSLTPKRKD